MNCPEKIAGAYLRLNGFFLLPHFTIFKMQRDYHHVDFLALRPPSSGGFVYGGESELRFPLDDSLLGLINAGFGVDPFRDFIGSVVEVKGNNQFEVPTDDHIEYASQFMGGEIPICPLLGVGNFLQDILEIGKPGSDPHYVTGFLPDRRGFKIDIGDHFLPFVS